MKTNAQTTSIDAYYNHGSQSASQRDEILQFITKRGGDWSIGEIASALRLQKSTISARVNELVNDTRELEERAKRKDRISNITVRPVGLPRMQMFLI